jgi:hypothetical protein
MHTKRCLRGALILVACTAAVDGQRQEWRRMLDASVAEQTAWIKSYLGRGMPVLDPDSSVITMLILNKPDVALPLIEQKIEKVLQSASSPDNFTDKSIDPQKFVDLAAIAIMEAGDGQSLKEIGKLIKLDEKRFGYLIERTLIQATSYRNPFVVAYQGLDIGDPAIDSRIIAWAKLQLDLLDNKPLQRTPGPPDQEAVREYENEKARTWWAEAMVNKYGGVPSEAQWRSDPIVSRLKANHADSVHDPMIRLASGIVEKRAQSPASPPR